MKTVVLEGSPGLSSLQTVRKPSRSLQCLVRHTGGQPLFGVNRNMFCDFVPLSSQDNHFKQLLSISETDDSAPEPVDSLKELAKAEKIAKGQDHTEAPLKEKIFDSNFEMNAKEYVDHSKANQIDTFDNEAAGVAKMEEKPVAPAQNSAELATILAAIKKQQHVRSRPKPRGRKIHYPSSKKQSQKPFKKLSPFRVTAKKK